MALGRPCATREAFATMAPSRHPAHSEHRGILHRVNSRPSYPKGLMKTNAAIPTYEPGTEFFSSPKATPKWCAPTEILLRAETASSFEGRNVEQLLQVRL